MFTKALWAVALFGVGFGIEAAGEAQYPLKALNEGDYAVFAVTQTSTREGAEEPEAIVENTWRYSVIEKTDEEVTIERTIEWDGAPGDRTEDLRTYPLDRAASPALLYDILFFNDKFEVKEVKVIGTGTGVMYADESDEAEDEDGEKWFWISLQVALSAEGGEVAAAKVAAKIFLNREFPFLDVVRIESEQVVEHTKGGSVTIVTEMDFIEGGSDE